MRPPLLAPLLAALLCGCSPALAPPQPAALSVAPPPEEPEAPELSREEAAPAVHLLASPIAPSAPPPHRPFAPVGRPSSRLPSGFFNPMPGGYFSGYDIDTGLDISGYKLPVHALAAGVVEYAEAGHTRWRGRGDSRYSIRVRLDRPVAFGGRHITHYYFGHLSSLEIEQPEGAATPFHVEGGDRLGVSGWANGSPHLHIGLLLDGEVEQRWGTYLLEDDIRVALGGFRNRERLPLR